MTGKTPLQIFVEAGINVNILGRKQPQKGVWKGGIKFMQNMDQMGFCWKIEE